MPKRVTKKPNPNKETLEVIYPKPTVRLGIGDKALTLEDCKKLLGWTEVGEKDRFHLRDKEDKRIWLNNNKSNRPIRKANLDKLMQEHLNGRWEFNGEPILVGEYGSILNGQHSCLSFIFACQLAQQDPEAFPNFPGVMEKAITFGIPEKDRIINTLDTCAPRTLSDVLYRSEYFKDLSTNERRQVARVCHYAIHTLWSRVGVADAFTSRITHTEAVAFLESHSRLAEFSLDVFHENGDNVLSNMMSLGFMAALHYLAACSSSSPGVYSEARHEDVLEWDNADKALEYLICLSSQNKKTLPVIEAYAELIQTTGGSRKERMALWILGWNAWLQNGKVTAKDLKLEWIVQDGIKHLVTAPSLGGIDLLTENLEL